MAQQNTNFYFFLLIQYIKPDNLFKIKILDNANALPLFSGGIVSCLDTKVEAN
jgi:hypothetical protein